MLHTSASPSGGNKLAIIELLDSPNADPSRRIPDSDGRNPFQYALQESPDECIIELLSHPRTHLDEQVNAIKMLCDLNKSNLAGAILKLVLMNNPPGERVDKLSAAI